MMLRRANPGMMMLAPLALQVPVVVVDNENPLLQTVHAPAASQTSQFDGHVIQSFEKVEPVVNSPVHSTQCPLLPA